MTNVLVTVDTELSALLHQRGVPLADNVASSIWGRCEAGEFGVGWQMDQVAAHGGRAVFFVDPLPALVYGETMLAEIVRLILARGHEVQLHLHTEWLEWALASPVGGRQGRNIGDFSVSDQVTLLSLGVDLLERAGAPRPIAFRAGNFGANDETLCALAELGIAWDSSVNATYFGRGCEISCSADQVDPCSLNGVVELPVSGLYDFPGQLRPAQVCALSSWEMRAALHHAARVRQRNFMVVTHSFEMLSRDRRRPNRMVMDRFQAMCRTIGTVPGLNMVGFGDLDAVDALRPAKPSATRLGPNRLRTLHRMGAQALATWRFERQLRPV